MHVDQRLQQRDAAIQLQQQRGLQWGSSNGVGRAVNSKTQVHAAEVRA